MLFFLMRDARHQRVGQVGAGELHRQGRHEHQSCNDENQPVRLGGSQRVCVRVVGVAPGLTLTSDWLQGERFEQLHKLSPLGRSSTAEDVAATVAFALANRSMTGSTVLVDGGQHLQRFDRDFSKM